MSHELLDLIQKDSVMKHFCRYASGGFVSLQILLNTVMVVTMTSWSLNSWKVQPAPVI